MSVGNIRLNNINMNKYDAAQSTNVGTSSRMSMDNHGSASMDSSVSANWSRTQNMLDQENNTRERINSIDTSNINRDNNIHEKITREQETTEFIKGVTAEDRGAGGALKLNSGAIKQDIMGGTDRSGYLQDAYQHYKNMRNAERLHDRGELSDEQVAFYREQYDRYMSAYTSAASNILETQYLKTDGVAANNTDINAHTSSKSTDKVSSEKLHMNVVGQAGVGAGGGVGINDSLSQGGGGDSPDKRVSQGKQANINVGVSTSAGYENSEVWSETNSKIQTQTNQSSVGSQFSDGKNINNTQEVLRNQLDGIFEASYRNGQNNLNNNTPGALKALNNL